MKAFLSVLLLSSSLFILSCNKEETSASSTLKIRMTDAPTAMEEVNIDLESVQVKFHDDSTSSSGWQTLQTNAGIYNLLDFQNGVDTLIATGTNLTGTVKEIRLIVGDSNTVKVNGVVHPLTIPSGAESGLKIKVSKKLQATLETLLIDFDAALSVKQEQNGYKLRPVVKLK